jgi:hypothetical protein
MANKNDLFDFDETTATNNDNVQGANIAENCAPSGINNAIRGLASIVKRAVGAQGAAIPSAATTAIGAAGTALYATITGSTTITSFGAVAAGTFRIIEFTGSLILTHNTTSLKLPGGANIVTQAGDVAFLVSLGSGNWKCLKYTRSAGLPALELLSVQSASNSATIDFVLTSYLSQFRALQVVVTDMVPGTDNTEFEMRTSTNGGSPYDATPGDYHWGYTVAQASGASADAGSTGNSFISLGSSIGNTSGRSWNGEVTIYNPTGSSVNKVVKVDSIYTTSAGTVRRLVGGGARVVTADIDAIRFLMSSGNIASDTFALYGIR